MNERSFSPVEASATTAEQAIMTAALELFWRRGFHGTSMREIATGADVSLGNIYNYFPSKGAILLEILREANAAQMAATEAAIAAAGDDVRDRLSAAVAAFVSYEIAEQAACFVANSELHYLDDDERERLVRERDRHQAIFESLIDEGVRAGAFRTPFPRQAALALLTMCAGVTLWYRPSGPLTPDEIAEHYSRYALALVEAS
jgi:AcrR family transcriptional regulator